MIIRLLVIPVIIIVAAIVFNAAVVHTAAGFLEHGDPFNARIALRATVPFDPLAARPASDQGRLSIAIHYYHALKTFLLFHPIVDDGSIDMAEIRERIYLLPDDFTVAGAWASAEQANAAAAAGTGADEWAALTGTAPLEKEVWELLPAMHADFIERLQAHRTRLANAVRWMEAFDTTRDPVTVHMAFIQLEDFEHDLDMRYDQQLPLAGVRLALIRAVVLLQAGIIEHLEGRMEGAALIELYERESAPCMLFAVDHLTVGSSSR